MLHLFLHLRLGIFRACLNVALKSHRSQLYLIPHVSIASALSNDIFCHLVLTFKKSHSCPWMLWLFVIFKGLLSCCFEVTLITIEIDPFMFLLFVKSQTTFVLCFVLTLITINYYPLMFRLFVHTQMTFLCCLVLTLITIRFDIHVF